MQIQKTIAKDFSHPKKPKTKNSKSTPLYNNTMELVKKKNKQKKFKCRQEYIKKPKKTPATGDNTIDAIKK